MESEPHTTRSRSRMSLYVFHLLGELKLLPTQKSLQSRTPCEL